MSIVANYLSNLGFDDIEIKIFQVLAQNGPLTLLEISRKSKIERTKLYRIMDQIAQKGLVEEIPNYKKLTYKAASLSTIELIVKENKLKGEFLTNNFPTFVHAVNKLTPNISKNNVIYYHGREGIRQMAWHLLRTKGIFRTYSYRFWDEILGEKFTLSLNEEMLGIKLKVQDIYSDQYISYKQNWLKIHKHKPKGTWDFWKSRYISENILKVDQNIDIYNDVVAYYHWEGDETFGVEIYNQRVADFHKQTHDVLWKMAKPIPDIDWSKEW